MSMADKRIGNRTFQVKTPLATEAIALQFRVMNLLGGATGDLPQIMAAIGKASSGGDDERLQANGQVVASLFGILSKVQPKDAVSFLRDVVAMAEVKGDNGRYEPADIDTEFSADPAGLYELVGFVLREAIGPFISGLVGSMSQQKRGAA